MCNSNLFGHTSVRGHRKIAVLRKDKCHFHLLTDMNLSEFTLSQLASALTFQLLWPQIRSGGLQG